LPFKKYQLALISLAFSIAFGADDADWISFTPPFSPVPEISADRERRRGMAASRFRGGWNTRRHFMSTCESPNIVDSIGQIRWMSANRRQGRGQIIQKSESFIRSRYAYILLK
jgi:hypothetical protein